MRCDSAAVMRDLPIPGSPETNTTRPSPSFACCQRRNKSSSSSSRPTSGVVPERNASKRLTTPLSPTTRQAALWLGKTGERLGPEILDLEQVPICRRVLSATTRVPGRASACRRAARFGVSPTTPRSCAAPAPIRSPTTTRPLAMPIRTFSGSCVASRPTASMTASPARAARSASSSCASG